MYMTSINLFVFTSVLFPIRIVKSVFLGDLFSSSPLKLLFYAATLVAKAAYDNDDDGDAVFVDNDAIYLLLFYEYKTVIIIMISPQI